MKTFLLVVRDRPEDFAGLDAEAMAAIVARYTAWAATLAEKGRLAGGQKLSDAGGRVVRGNGGRIAISDGPFAESREVIGGYFVLLAEDESEAMQLIADHPHLATRGSLELREVDTSVPSP